MFGVATDEFHECELVDVVHLRRWTRTHTNSCNEELHVSLPSTLGELSESGTQYLNLVWSALALRIAL